MNIRQRITRNLILTLFLIIALGLVGCTSDSEMVRTDSGSVEIKDSSFKYDEEGIKISGYTYIGLSGIITENSQYTQEVKLTNFIVKTGCNKKSFTISPDEIQAENKNFKLDIEIELNEFCNEPFFTLEGEKITKVTLLGDTLQEPEIKIDKWEKIFKLKGIIDKNLTEEKKENVNDENNFNIESDVGSIEVVDSAFIYDENKINISGYAYFGLNKIVKENPNYTQEIKFTNLVATTNCNKKSFAVSPAESTIKDNTNIKVELQIELIESCNQSTFTLSGEKIVKTVFLDENSSKIPLISLGKWSKTFNIQDTGNKVNIDYSKLNIDTGVIKEIDSSFAYDNDNLNISGYTYLGLTKKVKENSKYKQEIKFTNIIATTDCNKKSFTISPEKAIINNNDNVKINVDIVLNEICHEQTFTLSGEKVATTTYIGEDAPEPVVKVDKWSKDFDLKNNTDIIINTDYSGVKLSIDKMNLNTNRYATLDFIDVGDTKKLLNNSDINNVKLTIQNPSMLEFLDTPNSVSLTYSGSSSKKIFLKSKFKAGVGFIKMEATVKNRKIIEMLKIVILSGPISSMSIVLEGSEKKGAFYENTYQIHPVDEYGNKANSGEKIYIGVVNGVKKVNSGKYLYSEKSGKITNETSNNTIFSPNLGDLTGMDIERDKLVILADENRMYPDYLGGWSIADKTTNSNLSSGKLYLDEQYSGRQLIKTDKLRFVIGNERRYNKCVESISVADVDMDNNIYEIDDYGNAVVKLKYDPYLLGNSVYLYANTIPSSEDKNSKRVGVAINELLFGTGITVTPKNQVFDGYPKEEEDKDDNKTNEDDNKTIKKAVDIKNIPKTETGIMTLTVGTDLVKNTVVGVTASGEGCILKYIKPNTECNGIIKFTITTPAGGKCSVTYTGIAKDSDSKHFD